MGLAGTAAVTVVAVSVSLFMANLTVHHWLAGTAVNIRGNYDQQLVERFRELAFDAAEDLREAPKEELSAALVQAFPGLDSSGSQLWGVADQRGSLFAGGLSCSVPASVLTPVAPVKTHGFDTWVVHFSCQGVPVLAVASQAHAGTVVIAGQLLDESYVDALATATQLEVTMYGGPSAAITSMRNAAGERLPGQAFPALDFGSANVHAPSYRGYLPGTRSETATGEDDVSMYFASVELDPAFAGRRLAFCLPRWLILQATVLTAGTLLLTMMVLFGAMVLIARRLARKIADPVHALAALTKKIADGDLEVQVPDLDSTDELHELGSSFNRMVSSLKDMRRRVFQTEKLAAVGQLSASVAHEINNPLAYIIGNLSYAIERLKTGEPLDDALEESLEGAKRIAQIVRDLKTFSRSEDDKEEHSRVDVETTLDSAVKMAGNRIRHRARLVKNYAPVGEVLANPGRLAQVFLNLLVNAADAISPGRADENQILLRLEQKAGEVVVQITDTGGGIPADVRARLFEPFFTTKPIGVGTGLGLSICKNIIEAAGGSIEIQPGPANRGTTVVLTMPLAPVEQAEVEDEDDDPTPLPVMLSRVLVIDDDAAVLRSVKRMLEPGYAVVTANSASAALERLGAGERFDLLICDLMMPEVTGIELHQHLTRSCPALSKRMLFITGGAFTPDAAPFLDENRERVLEKPIGPNKLREAVEHAIAATAEGAVARTAGA
ncbi:MAG: ATP-binding protein [Myxococcaceae bacterium]